MSNKSHVVAGDTTKENSEFPNTPPSANDSKTFVAIDARIQAGDVFRGCHYRNSADGGGFYATLLVHNGTMLEFPSERPYVPEWMRASPTPVS